jgi:formyl-CoA transferase
LLESQIFMLDFQAARYLMDGDIPGQVGNGHPTLVPTGAYPTRDGHVNIAPSSPRQWQTFCELVGKPEWLTRAEWSGFRNRQRARAEIDAAIGQETRAHTTAYWVERLEQAGIPCGPIYRMDEVFADPQVKHLQMAAPVEHPERGTTQLVASPLNFEGTEKRIRSPASTTGADPGQLAFNGGPKRS